MFKPQRHLCLLIAISLISPAIHICANQSTEIKALEKILKVAAKKSPIMLTEDLKIAQADASRLRGYTTYLPEVSANYDVGGFHEIRKSIRSDDANRIGARYTIRAAHPLYHWGAVDAMRGLGFAKESIAQLEARIVFAQLCNLLRKDFLDMLTQKAELKKMDCEIELAAATLEKVKLAAKRGKATDTKLKHAKILHKSLQIEKIHFKNQLMLSVAKFQSESGDNDFNLDHLPTTLPTIEIDLEQLKKEFEAFKNNGFDQAEPSKLAKKSQTAIKDKITITKAEQLPTFNIGAGMSQQPYENSAGTYELQTVFFAGITGEWTLFDRAETRDNLRSLLVEKSLVSAKLNVSRNRLQTEAQGYLDIFEVGMQATKLREEDIKIVSKTTEVAQAKYNKGQIDLEELSKEKLRLAQSEHKMLKDKTNVFAAYYAFKSSMFADPALNYYDPYKNILVKP